MWFSNASAKMLRAELCVHRKSTFNGLDSVTLDLFDSTSFTNFLSPYLTGFPLPELVKDLTHDLSGC
jgi:hypothetical protein